MNKKMKKYMKNKAVFVLALGFIILFTGCQPTKETYKDGDQTDTESAVTTNVTTKEQVTTVIETEEKPVQLYAFQEDGLYGYVNADKKVVIKPKFLYAEDFAGNRAIVKEPVPIGKEYYGILGQGVYGLIDPKGNYVIPPEGIVIRVGEKRFLTSGPKEVWYGYGPTNLAVTKYHFTDENGIPLTETEFYDVTEISNQLYLANDGKYSCFINAQGESLNNYPVFRFYAKGQKVGNNIVVKPYDDRDDRIVITVSPEGSVLEQTTQEVKVTDTLTYTTDIISPYIGTSYFYPVFYGEDPLAVESLNQNIADILDVLMYGDMPFEVDTENLADISQIDRTMVTDYTVTTVNDIINVDIDGYWYGFGAAHPNAFILSYYMDKVSGKSYTLNDLFLDNSDWRMAIAELVDQQFMKETDFFLFFDKDTPEKERLEEFYKENYDAAVTEEGLKIYYQQYEIAPYAAGFPTFVIPYEKLLPYMDKESDFYKSLM